MSTRNQTSALNIAIQCMPIGTRVIFVNANHRCIHATVVDYFFDDEGNARCKVEYENEEEGCTYTASPTVERVGVLL